MKNLKNILFIALACLPLSLAAANPQQQHLDDNVNQQDNLNDDEVLKKYNKDLYKIEADQKFRLAFSGKNQDFFSTDYALDDYREIREYFDWMMQKLAEKKPSDQNYSKEKEEAKARLKEAVMKSRLYNSIGFVWKHYLKDVRNIRDSYHEVIYRMVSDMLESNRRENRKANEEDSGKLKALLGLIWSEVEKPNLEKVMFAFSDLMVREKLNNGISFLYNKEKGVAAEVMSYVLEHALNNKDQWDLNVLDAEAMGYLIEAEVYDKYMRGEKIGALKSKTIMNGMEQPLINDIATMVVKNKNYYALAYLLKEGIVTYQVLEKKEKDELLKAVAANVIVLYKWLDLTQKRKSIPIPAGVVVEFSGILNEDNKASAEYKAMLGVLDMLVDNQPKLAAKVLSSLLEGKQFRAANEWASRMSPEGRKNVIKFLIAQNKWEAALDATTKVDALKEVRFSPPELGELIAGINKQIDWEQAGSFIASQKKGSGNFLFNQGVHFELNRSRVELANQFAKHVMKKDPNKKDSLSAQLEEEESSDDQDGNPTLADDRGDNLMDNGNNNNKQNDDRHQLLNVDPVDNKNGGVLGTGSSSSSGGIYERVKKGLFWFSVFVIGGSCVYIVYIKYDELMAFMQKKLNWGKTDAVSDGYGDDDYGDDDYGDDDYDE